MDELDKFLKKNDERQEKYLPIIERMLSNVHKYGWAEETLLSIWEGIDSGGGISEKQVEVVERIRDLSNRRRYY